MAATKQTPRKATAKKAVTKAAAKAVRRAVTKAVKKAAPPAAKKAAAKKPAAKKSVAQKAAAKKPVAQKAARKPAAKAAAKRPAKKLAQPSPTSRPAPAKSAKTKADVLDFGAFRAGSVTKHSTTLCLGCIFRLFTKQLGLAPRTAHAEIRRYAPTVAELTARDPQRPFFKPADDRAARCPYCDAARRWHARVDTYRVESGRFGDAARRALLKSLPTRDEQFQVHEERKTERDIFFEWLERLGQRLDFEDDRAWMTGAARAYLERREPKADWAAEFAGVRRVYRSHRLEEGWEREGDRLFLAPPLYNDVLLVQYLVSRSHRHGGRTFEGRLTLPELVRRMRSRGHLDAQGITDRDQFEVLEQLVEQLTGGDRPARLHFIVDRRDLLEKVKTIASQ